MRARFIDVGGIRTRILEEGVGKRPALLLVHGFGAIAEHWFRNIDELGQAFHVVAPDLIGHGFTDPVRFGGTPPHPKTVDHLSALADALGLETFAVCGSSYGALISALLYFKNPQRVSRYVVCGSGSMFNTEEELAKALPAALANASQAMKDPTFANCRRRLGNICYGGEAAVPEATAHAHMLSYAYPHLLEVYEDAMRGMMDQAKSRPYRVLERLEQIRVPTLIVWGREDPRGIYQRAVENAPRFPNARLVTFEKCGHLPFLEQPAAFNREIVAFLKGA